MTKEQIRALRKDAQAQLDNKNWTPLKESIYDPQARLVITALDALEAAQGECERLRQRLKQIQTRAEADWKIHAETSAELTRLRAENEALRAFRGALTEEEWKRVWRWLCVACEEHGDNPGDDEIRAKLAKALEESK